MRLNTISSSHCILNAKRIHANLNQRCLKEIHINRSEIIITIVSEFLQNQQFYWKILRHPRNGTMPSWKSRNWITVECRQFHRQSDVYTLASGPRNEPIALEFRTDDTRSVYYRSIGGLFVILTPSIPYLSPVPEGISSQWLSRACGWRSRNGIYSLSLSLSLSLSMTRRVNLDTEITAAEWKMVARNGNRGEVDALRCRNMGRSPGYVGCARAAADYRVKLKSQRFYYAKLLFETVWNWRDT